ncbi:hypothetical protein [Amycolatopsis albispora]|uniref:Uncharacterized protein n=1 Tax=Amycolatopsis albispora TaxID=1804986 RepID=A0A344KZL5_9PSEU|nr:hypothetical protein [Amycolatopsis albispora]AXB41239.1 hypothetical protein A4R43_00830 [Amycolatopsis albispora]
MTTSDRSPARFWDEHYRNRPPAGRVNPRLAEIAETAVDIAATAVWGPVATVTDHVLVLHRATR